MDWNYCQVLIVLDILSIVVPLTSLSGLCTIFHSTLYLLVLIFNPLKILKAQFCPFLLPLPSQSDIVLSFLFFPIFSLFLHPT